MCLTTVNYIINLENKEQIKKVNKILATVETGLGYRGFPTHFLSLTGLRYPWLGSLEAGLGTGMLMRELLPAGT